jgi:hypothetical protein
MPKRFVSLDHPVCGAEEASRNFLEPQPPLLMEEGNALAYTFRQQPLAAVANLLRGQRGWGAHFPIRIRSVISPSRSTPAPFAASTS